MITDPPSIGKIHLLSKIAITLEPVVRFRCPSRFRISVKIFPQTMSESVNELISHEAVCRTALATMGLLKIGLALFLRWWGKNWWDINIIDHNCISMCWCPKNLNFPCYEMLNWLAKQSIVYNRESRRSGSQQRK